MNFFEKLEYLMYRDGIKNLKVMSEKSGIPYTTLKGLYTRGVENIKLTTLHKLSRFFDTTLDYLMNDEITDVNYGKDRGFKADDYENEMVKKYRFLDQHGKKIVGIVLDAEYERVRYSKQDKMEKVITLPTIVDEPEENETVEIRVFNIAAAAGFGNYLLDDDCNYEMLAFSAVDVPAKASFGIRISGDSMEPSVEDGAIVWVEERLEINNGEIGIFILNGDSYCKALQIDYDSREVSLVSHNEKYKPIKIREADDLRTVGKVLVC